MIDMDSKFKKWADKYNENPSEQTWNKINQKISTRKNVSSSRKRNQRQHLIFIVLSSLLILAILILAYIGFTYYASKGDKNSHVVDKRIEELR